MPYLYFYKNIHNFDSFDNYILCETHDILIVSDIVLEINIDAFGF